MIFSNKDVIHVWEIENLTHYHIHMEDDKHITRWAILKIPLKLNILMINETLKLV